jgi:hypothetical protein
MCRGVNNAPTVDVKYKSEVKESGGNGYVKVSPWEFNGRE